jgi:probable O-glycosylation ligase (exosortase A-associated)
VIFYGLLAFFLVEYIRPGMYIPAINATHINSLVPLGIFVGTLVFRAPVSNPEALAEPNTRKVGFLLGLIAVSVVTADVTEFAFNLMTVVIGYVMVYWVIVKQVTTLEQIKKLFFVLTLVHIVVAALTPGMFTSSERQYVASGSFLGDGNDFALSVNIAIPMCLFLLFDAKKVLPRLFYCAAMLFLVISVVATQSRGGTIALVVVGLYYWLKSESKLRTGVLAAIAVVVVFAFAPPEYFMRMHDVANTQEGSAQGRIEAWKAGVNMALDHPLLGVGVGHFPVKYGAVYKRNAEGPWRTAHSIYFLILGELGFPGLIVLLMFIFGNLAANRRLAKLCEERDPTRRNTDLALLACTSAAMLAFATGGAFLSAIYYPHLYILAGVLAASRRIVSLRRQDSAPAVATTPVSLDYHPAMRRLASRRRTA